MSRVNKETPLPTNFKALFNKKFEDLAVPQATKLTPEQFFNLAVRYFTWAEENAIHAGESASYQGEISQWDVSKPRVFTINGLVLYCGIARSTYESLKKKPQYEGVIEFVETVIHEQKFQLAANGMVNSSLIIKDLGLDKGAQITVTSNNANVSVNDEKMVEAVRSVLGEL